MTYSRSQAVLAAVVLLSIALPVEAGSRSACELLPESLVRSVTGKTLHIDPRPSPALNARLDVCTYIGEGATFRLSVTTLESERPASREFTREVTRILGSGTAGQPLRGVGVEARFGASGHPEDNTIIARYGAIVFVLTGPADQEALVALARSVLAQLERLDPE